jgi:hypothetical protein
MSYKKIIKNVLNIANINNYKAYEDDTLVLLYWLKFNKEFIGFY